MNKFNLMTCSLMALFGVYMPSQAMNEDLERSMIQSQLNTAITHFTIPENIQNDILLEDLSQSKVFNSSNFDPNTPLEYVSYNVLKLEQQNLINQYNNGKSESLLTARDLEISKRILRNRFLFNKLN